MPVYQGHNSCYAIHEGIYVRRLRRKGIDTVAEAAGILYLIVRDYRRHRTYEQRTCREIPMDKELFEKRVNYVYTLARRWKAGPRELAKIKRLVKFVLENKRLPKNKNIRKLVKKAITRIR